MSNGNYIVRSPDWDNGSLVDAGAVTWGNGTSGVHGLVSVSNSLVGGSTGDNIGGCFKFAQSMNAKIETGVNSWWDETRNASEAVSTKACGAGGDNILGVNDLCISALSNGNYVVGSPYWDNGGIADAGAATWGNGSSGTSGVVTVTNSLVGVQINDRVGYGGVFSLSNGNYVVSSPLWGNGGISDAGAATWGNGTSGSTGEVSAANSLVGTKIGDQVSYGSVTALSNDNYVVSSPWWDNGGIANVGAVTWRSGASAMVGAVSAANSLIGSYTSDVIGIYVTALENGNYVASSGYWDNGGIVDVGAVTWGNGMSGVSGVVSTTNSLIGSQAGDQIGYYGVTALCNGNYVVHSGNWKNGGISNAGAITWVNGASSTSGVVTVTNSLVGSQSR